MLVGNAGVGKSCFLIRFSDNKYKEQYDVTIGVEFGTKTINIANQPVKVQIWDTAGQENYRSITRSFYRKAHAIILMYDVSNRASFDNLDNWLKDIKENSPKDVFIYLVGNQTDVLEHQSISRQVTFEEAESYKKKNSLAGFKETSAKIGTNVHETFTDLCTIMNKSKKNSTPAPPKSEISIVKPNVRRRRFFC